MSVALLSCHALLRKYLKLLHKSKTIWLTIVIVLTEAISTFKKEATNCLFIKKFIFNLLFDFPLFLNLHTLNWYIIHPAKSLPHTIYNFYQKKKKILKKNYKKKTNKKLSSNYIKLKIVCKYARKSKSSEKEKENTSKSFCLTSLSLNTISLSKVKKMFQKIILHLSTDRKIPEQKFFICPPPPHPPMLSKIKNQKSIHTFYHFFFQLVHLQFILSKNSKKAYLQQIKQISKKKRSKKSFKKFFVQHCTCTQ